MKPTRLLSWNLAHQTREAPIPATLLPALGHYSADVVVLNEYVDAGSRESLHEGLRDLGYSQIHTSLRVGRHNQVLIATKRSSAPAGMEGPDLPGGAGRSNFLHVRFVEGWELVGLRAPMYNGEKLVLYWEQLVSLIRSCGQRKVVWIGDLNADPESPRLPGKCLASLQADGWAIPRADGPWSFYRGSRIDHVVIPPSVAFRSAHYVTEARGQVLVGAPGSGFISDHAALLVDLGGTG